MEYPLAAIFIRVIRVFIRAYWCIKKEPAMEIAGLCLPLKPQKERGYVEYNIENFRGDRTYQANHCRWRQPVKQVIRLGYTRVNENNFDWFAGILEGGEMYTTT